MQTAYTLGELKKLGARHMGAAETAESDWINTIKRVAKQTEEFQKSYTPGYYNNEGHIEFEFKNTFLVEAPSGFSTSQLSGPRRLILKGLEIS